MKHLINRLRHEVSAIVTHRFGISACATDLDAKTPNHVAITVEVPPNTPQGCMVMVPLAKPEEVQGVIDALRERASQVWPGERFR